MFREETNRNSFHTAWGFKNSLGLVNFPELVPGLDGELVTNVEFVEQIIASDQYRWRSTSVASKQRIRVEKIIDYVRQNFVHTVLRVYENAVEAHQRIFPNTDNPFPASVTTTNTQLTVQQAGSSGIGGLLASMWRLAGIPAIDIFTPDNHGAAKVYFDGDWHYLPGNYPLRSTLKNFQVQYLFLTQKQFEESGE